MFTFWYEGMSLKKEFNGKFGTCFINILTRVVVAQRDPYIPQALATLGL